MRETSAGPLSGQSDRRSHGFLRSPSWRSRGRRQGFRPWWRPGGAVGVQQVLWSAGPWSWREPHRKAGLGARLVREGRLRSRPLGHLGGWRRLHWKGPTWKGPKLLNLCSRWRPLEMGIYCHGPTWEGDKLLNLCSRWGPLEMGIYCQKGPTGQETICQIWVPDGDCLMGIKWQRSKMECDKMQKIEQFKYLQQKQICIVKMTNIAWVMLGNIQQKTP